MGLATIFYEVPIWLYYFQKDMLLGNINLVKTTFYFPHDDEFSHGNNRVYILLLAKKEVRLEKWFALLVLAALLLTFLFNSIYFGNMRPDIQQSTVPFRINNQENAHLWGNKLYIRIMKSMAEGFV